MRSAGGLCGVISLGSSYGEMLFLPGLELAVWKCGTTIPDPKLRGRDGQQAR